MVGYCLCFDSPNSRRLLLGHSGVRAASFAHRRLLRHVLSSNHFLKLTPLSFVEAFLRTDREFCEQAKQLKLKWVTRAKFQSELG